METVRHLLIHSPLVTEVTWSALARVLSDAGFRVTVPAFDNVASVSGRYHEHHLAQLVRRIPPDGDGPVIAVAHSGAGNILASMRPERFDAHVMLDATFPTSSGSRFDLFDASAVEAWRAIAYDNNGVLPEAMLRRFGDQIVGDELRAELTGSLRDVPVGLYEETIPVAAGWPSEIARGLYVQWTSVYAADAVRARAAGFDVRVMPGSHFEMVNKPRAVARVLIDVARALRRPGF